MTPAQSARIDRARAALAAARPETRQYWEKELFIARWAARRPRLPAIRAARPVIYWGN